MERVPFTSTVLTRLPVTSFSRSRRIVSTSGSSGTAGGLLERPGQRLPGGPGRRLFGVLLRPALALPHGLAADVDDRRVPAGVVGPRSVHVVARELGHQPDDRLLQPGLVVLGSRTGSGGGDPL